MLTYKPVCLDDKFIQPFKTHPLENVVTISLIV